MKSLEIINNLAPKKQSIFVSGDPGVAEMQQDLKKYKSQRWKEKALTQEDYENVNGVFLRFSIEGIIYSGIIQTENTTETRGFLLDIPLKLREKNVDLLTILQLPLHRIPLFPFFTTLDEFQFRELIQEMSRKYWASFTDDTESLRNWYSDFIRLRREIVNTEIPQLEASVPSWLGSLQVYALYNEKNRIIATRYYRGIESKDVVLIEKTSEPVGLKTEEAFSNTFTLPSKEAIISESIKYSIVGEKAFSDWKHPYFSAVEELKKQVEKFNRSQPSTHYDAYAMSRSLIHNWTYEEIRKRRELANRFLEFKEALQHWLKPVQVLLVYFVDKAREGWITDGVISAHYVNGPEDKIIVERVEDKDKVKLDEDMVRKYLPASEGKLFYGFQSFIREYLREKLGANY